MADLIPCIDCGQSISASASSCPKCQSEYPRGVHCTFCYGRFPSAFHGGRFSSDAMPTIRHISIKDAVSHKKWGGTLEYYHLECVKKLLTPPDNSACPDCRIPIARFWDWEKLFKITDWYNTACPNCGSKHVLMRETFPSFCDLCALPLLRFHNAVSRSREHYHDLCVPHWLKCVEGAEDRQTSNKGSGCAVLAMPIFLLISLVFHTGI
jgi:Zn finger protein HypA/HybF involved in hydrogenase expression